jgi:hypothetical protein
VEINWPIKLRLLVGCPRLHRNGVYITLLVVVAALTHAVVTASTFLRPQWLHILREMHGEGSTLYSRIYRKTRGGWVLASENRVGEMVYGKRKKEGKRTELGQRAAGKKSW